MSFIKELILLTRFEHAVMLAIAVLMAETIVLGSFPALTMTILLSLLVPVLSEMGSFALNDYLDVETDRLNKKTDRPLVRGALSTGFALWFSLACLASSTLLAYFINLPAFAIAVVFNILAIAYNLKLKDLPLLGNCYIALTMAIPFIFGNFVVAEKLSEMTVVLALLGFLSGFAREIIKSVEDMEGDAKARKSKTLPLIIGERPALMLASVIYLLFVPLTTAPFMLGLNASPVPIALVAIADLGIFYIIRLLFNKKEGDGKKALKTARTLSLAALFIGLIGLLIASLPG